MSHLPRQGMTKTITVYGNIQIAILDPEPEDTFIITMMKAGDIMEKYKASLIRSVSYIAKDDFDLELSTKELQIFDEEYELKLSLRKEMNNLKKIARSLSENNKFLKKENYD